MLWRYMVTVHVCYGDMWSPYMYVMAIYGHRTCVVKTYPSIDPIVAPPILITLYVSLL